MSSTSTRTALLVAACLLAVVFVWDLSRQPSDQWAAAILLAGIDRYQRAISPALGVAGIRCRFEPTCSHYAEGVIRQRGALAGGWAAMTRLSRCGPWTQAGTVDPP